MRPNNSINLVPLRGTVNSDVRPHQGTRHGNHRAIRNACDSPYSVQIALPGASTFREGDVLKFESKGGESWVGNCQCGTGSYHGFLELHTERAAVIAGGQGHVVDAIRRTSQHAFGGDVMYSLPIPASSDFLPTGNTDVERHNSTHRAWWSKRLARDGTGKVQVKAGKLMANVEFSSYLFRRVEA